MITFARAQLGGSLHQLPEAIAHWKATGSGSVRPTTVKDAVAAFKEWKAGKVGSRTKSDIEWRLDAFAGEFGDRHLHQLNAGELETWIDSHAAAWSRRSFYKRLRPLFSHALRHRWIAADPMGLLDAPETPAKHKEVYAAKDFHRLIRAASGINEDGTRQTPTYPLLVPFLVLAGFGFMRSSELIRLYAHEEVLRWEDIDWSRKRIHVREAVGKATRRQAGNERFTPMTSILCDHLEEWRKETGFVIPLLHSGFSKHWQALHTKLDLKPIPNGLRRSAISHYLAHHPQIGVVQLAKWAGTSEATVKRHYFELLDSEQGQEWFDRESLLTPF
jgi:integrase